MGAHTLPAPGPEALRKRRRRDTLRYVVAPIFLVIIGLIIMLTPVVMTQFHNMGQSRVAQEYSEQIHQKETARLVEERERAHQWNSARGMRIAGDPWTIQPDLDSPEYRSYLDQLSITPVMSRIRVPSAQIDLPVYHGTEEHTLSQGAGHLF